MKIFRLAHRFVERFPEPLEPGILYVSLCYASMAHSCACGCGEEVITPLSPAGWQLTFDGQAISVSPSIGNGSFACRSHYWIRRGEVDWLDDLSDWEIEGARWRGRMVRDAYYSRETQEPRSTNEGEESPPLVMPAGPVEPDTRTRRGQPWWSFIAPWLRRD